MTEENRPGRRRGRARNGIAPTDEAELVNDLMLFIRRYVVMSPAQQLVVALWIIHTHCAEHLAQTPYLAVTSPERQCGKSRLLDVLELLVARPWLAVLPSEAVVYRTLHREARTLLLDETDTIFNPRTADRYEGLRALLNAGHRRGTTVPRCVGNTNRIEEFKVFSPKVLAGIGTLPDTVADRSVPIRLERRKPDELVEKFRRWEAEPMATPLRESVATWVAEHGEAVSAIHPEMPDELSDRMQEGCECLLAIADALGCGPQARAALVGLLTSERLDGQESMRLRLLRDIQAVFEQKKMPRGVWTKDLLDALFKLEEAPWKTYYHRGLDPKDLANLLGHFGISSTTIRAPIRFRTENTKEQIAKGYKRDSFVDAWERYL